jgi:hydroxymethylbilane synthase
MLPAVAQGAIGIERRADDSRAAAMLDAIHDGPTGQRLAAERAFLKGLDGSCQTPIAGLAELDGTTLRLRGEILRPDGSEVLTADRTAPVEDGAALGAEMAADLRQKAGPGFFDWH